MRRIAAHRKAAYAQLRITRLMSSAGLCAALACRAWWGLDRRASAAHNPEDSDHAARQGAGPCVIGGRPDGRFACAGVWPGRGTGAPGLQRLDDGVVPGLLAPPAEVLRFPRRREIGRAHV